MTRILVTGADGFTGRHLTPALARLGAEVHGLASRVPDPPVDGVHRWHLGNLLDPESLQRTVQDVRPDTVVHLAAIAFVAHGDVDSIYRTNIVGSRHLLAALADLPVRPRAVLMASSANVYGTATEGVMDERTPPSPANDYAVSKLAMEHMAGIWRERLPITLVRPFNYTGRGQSTQFLIPKIVDHFHRRAPVLELGNLDVERDFSDVRTVVDCYVRLLASPQPGQVFNVCSGVGHSLREVLEMARDLTGHEPEIRVNPAFVRANEVRRLLGSKAALEAAIGPVHGPALRETLAWMLQ
ncbi:MULTISPECIES: NAD-dependent epimerase/dehydratase family protein [Rubrivivax]|uniref:NAD-dependent epimerase/dehydratase family protein n=1 Tax=Rubrivivax benzoatilyticus TaxID=316997 RepID=A0ABX0HSB8_9BURK|nr:MULTISPECIES: NAD-dependent epimerase/dehydratase family protein [Rubrivivax]EGJ09959.1 GDP-6-deoxy-D-lyxo-4-hexulose reductase [Rubrivivax benzoatilyticus JA2 = ATCC BAA-35]NHK97940.1 NAD-dependent epimerase/dehydratase family protein [Rubrivivax benzoatilyticus]NHL23442.1 NAD-dependent epimerase/dehydratase family protein [Rubrivivax benzoatilyticus]